MSRVARAVTIVASRLPPRTDGVGDHAHRIACELARDGRDVLVVADGTGPAPGPYAVRRVGARWGVAAVRATVASLRARRAGTLVLEYTPFFYGPTTLAAVAMALAARALGMRRIVVAHESFHPASDGRIASRLKAAFWGLRDLATLSLASEIVVASSNRFRTVTARSPRLLRKTRIVPIGANLEPSATYVHRGAPLGEPLHLVTFGVVMRRRRVELLIEALGLAIAAGTPARLTIAGRLADPAYERELRAQIERLGLSGRVILTGALATERIEGIFTEADVALFSAVEGTIAASGVLLALLAFGLPIVALRTASDDPRFDPLVAHVAPEPAIVAGALGSADLDSERRVRMGREGAAFYAAHFSWSSIASRIAT